MLECIETVTAVRGGILRGKVFSNMSTSLYIFLYFFVVVLGLLYANEPPVVNSRRGAKIFRTRL